jgi:hypothetical protein
MQRHIARSKCVRFHVLDEVCLEDSVHALVNERGEGTDLEKRGSIGCRIQNVAIEALVHSLHGFPRYGGRWTSIINAGICAVSGEALHARKSRLGAGASYTIF